MDAFRRHPAVGWATTSLLVVAFVAACNGGGSARPIVTATAPVGSNVTMPLLSTPPLTTTMTPSATTSSPDVLRSFPAVNPWFALPDQQFTQSAAGVFALKLGAIIGPTVLLMYAMQTPASGPPQVAVTTTNDACSIIAPPTPLSSSVYDFGRLGADAVGIIAFSWQDQPGQILAIDITPPGFAAPVWHLTPLQQVAPARAGGSIIGVAGDHRALPEILVDMNGSFVLRGGQTGFVAQQDPGSAPRYVARVFFLVDSQGQVAQVTEAQYVAAGGGTGGANGTVAPITLAPTYPPTPTIPGLPGYTPAPPRIACAQG